MPTPIDPELFDTNVQRLTQWGERLSELGAEAVCVVGRKRVTGGYAIWSLCLAELDGEELVEMLAQIIRVRQRQATEPRELEGPEGIDLSWLMDASEEPPQ